MVGTKNPGHCREVAVSGGSTVIEFEIADSKWLKNQSYGKSKWNEFEITKFELCVWFGCRKAIFDAAPEDPNYQPLPEEDRPGGFNWGDGQRVGADAAAADAAAVDAAAADAADAEHEDWSHQWQQSDSL